MNAFAYILLALGGSWLIGSYVGNNMPYIILRHGRTKSERLLLTIICALVVMAASFSWGQVWSQWLL